MGLFVCLFVIIRTGRTLPIAASMCDCVLSHPPPSPIVRLWLHRRIAFQRCYVAGWCDMYIYGFYVVVAWLSLVCLLFLLSVSSRLPFYSPQQCPAGSYQVLQFSSLCPCPLHMCLLVRRLPLPYFPFPPFRRVHHHSQPCHLFSFPLFT